jgi:hypothetical protein
MVLKSKDFNLITNWLVRKIVDKTENRYINNFVLIVSVLHDSHTNHESLSSTTA